MNVWVLALALIVLALLQNFILRHFALRGLKYARRFSVPAAFEGETVHLTEVLRNDRPLFIPWLRAESRLSPYLRFGRQENLAVRGEMYHKSVFTLRPFQQITRRHTVTLLHRGAYDAGNVSLTVSDLLGMGAQSAQYYTPARILVYPRLLVDDALPLPVSRLQGEMIVRRHVVSDPFLVNGIRPYQHGDHPRDIHWPATARMGSLQVKTHDYTADTKLLVVINCQMSENQWSDLMDYEQAMIERAISMAATVCLRVLRAGVAAGFAANMPMDEDEACALLPPGRGPAREEELLSAFARLRVLRVRNFYSFLDDLSSLRGTDVLILTRYTSPLIEERLETLRRCGNSVTVQLLEGEATQ